MLNVRNVADDLKIYRAPIAATVMRNMFYRVNTTCNVDGQDLM